MGEEVGGSRHLIGRRHFFSKRRPGNWESWRWIQHSPASRLSSRRKAGNRGPMKIPRFADRVPLDNSCSEEWRPCRSCCCNAGQNAKFIIVAASVADRAMRNGQEGRSNSSRVELGWRWDGQELTGFRLRVLRIDGCVPRCGVGAFHSLALRRRRSHRTACEGEVASKSGTTSRSS